MMPRFWIALAAAAGLVLASAPPIRAQSQSQSNFAPIADNSSRSQGGGWTLTPTLIYSGSWDDNVLVRGKGDSETGDFTNVVNPRGSIGYVGRRTRIDATYDGAFLMYRQLSTLNSYDQHASLFAHQLLSKHVALFFNETLAKVPTTELVELVGVPFVRTGSTIEDARGGVEMALSSRTSIVASYNFQWVQFDPNADLATQLQGGHSHGGTLTWRRLLSSRTTLFADYDLQRATVLDGRDSFNVQNAALGLERRLSNLLRVFGAFGFARVGVNSFGPPRTGPAWRAGLTRQFQAFGVDAEYSRSFVPSYGFGGTLQNEEILARVRVPISRRLSAQSSVSWRSNQPLITNEPDLHTRWIEASLGYSMRPWLRVEGFYAGSRQTIDRPGGLVDRNRVGIQLITSNPMRVR